jgi:hypothetical protein
MAEIKEFVVNDRRKFTPEGELRPDAPQSREDKPREESAAKPMEKPTEMPKPVEVEAKPDEAESEAMPQLTEEQTAEAKRAFDATVDRLDTAVRASNPGMDHPPAMTFERLVQSLYMQAILQLGGAAEPGQKPQVDIFGARQTIDMLSVLAEKTKGNLTDDESGLVDNALFELRMGFLEMTQALARQAAAKQGPGAPGGGAPNGPSIVR